MTRRPLPRPAAWRAVARCVGTTGLLLVRGELRMPRGHTGRVFRFADDTGAWVYRETVVTREPERPCVLVVTFRLRRIRGRGHAAFRRESLLNTPLFAGFPGFVSKLWLAHDELGRYRGLYVWDDAAAAEHYARSLWRVLELVSERGSIDYYVLPGLHRADVPVDAAAAGPAGEGAWWRAVAVS
ncbi:hypothetical protein [Saccharomonospora iraqiensis]|uniref:hypothetical protein n=1 Tax=Saccharomonospora iraqiensis TaxID=52698 RepID=UPI00022DF866|nr:hypothetical protein [Saccharomonospora iraqiensis]